MSTAVLDPEKILISILVATWPSAPEAMAAIGNAKDTLSVALDDLFALRQGFKRWQDYDADLGVFAGDPQLAAIEIAEIAATNAARAALRVLAQYRRHPGEAGGTS